MFESSYSKKKKMLPKESKRRQILLFQTKRIIHQYLTRRRACKWRLCFSCQKCHVKKFLTSPTIWFALLFFWLIIVEYTWFNRLEKFQSYRPTQKKVATAQTKTKKKSAVSKTLSHTKKKKKPKRTNPNLRWVRWSKRQMMVSVLNQTIKKGMH